MTHSFLCNLSSSSCDSNFGFVTSRSWLIISPRFIRWSPISNYYYTLFIWCIFSLCLFGTATEVKQNGCLGNYADGSSYIAWPWWSGHTLFEELNSTIVILILFYGFAGLGIAVVNDFKSVEEDQKYYLNLYL